MEDVPLCHRSDHPLAFQLSVCIHSRLASCRQKFAAVFFQDWKIFCWYVIKLKYLINLKFSEPVCQIYI